MEDTKPMSALKHYVVTVVAVGDAYWSIQLFVDDESPEGAIQQAEGKFKEADSLGLITGKLRATNATPVEEFLS